MSLKIQDKATAFRTRAAAIVSTFGARTTVTLGETGYTATQLAQKYTNAANAYSAVASARTALQVALKARDAADVDIATVDTALHDTVKAQLGSSSPKLSEFAYTPQRAREVTVAKKADAIAASTATRKARHTMGKKQRLAIAGTTNTAATNGSTPATPSTPSTAH